MTRVRILIAMPHLGGGGAERVIALVAAHLDARLFETHLVTLTESHHPQPVLPVEVTRHHLNARRTRGAAPGLLALIRALRPQLVLGGMAHLNLLLLALAPLMPRGTRIVVRQQTTAAAVAPTLVLRRLYRALYPRADAILCQSAAMRQDLIDSFHLAGDRLHVLPNPVAATRPEPAKSYTAGSPIHLLTVGRLAPEKGHALLLEALAHLVPEHPDLHLTIVGTGLQKEHLCQLAAALGLASHLTLAGHMDNPAALFHLAALFVQPSLREAMPNALLEAAAAGLPIVTTPASPGLVELVQSQPGVWLSPDFAADSFATTLRLALRTLVSGEPLPRYHHGFVAPFTLERAIPEWQALLLRLAGTGIATPELNPR